MGIGIVSKGTVNLSEELRGLVSADQAERNKSFLQLADKLGLSDPHFNLSAVQSVVDDVKAGKLNISRDHGLNIAAATVKSMDDGIITANERLGTANVNTNQVTIGRIAAAIIRKDASFDGQENAVRNEVLFSKPVKIDMAMPGTDQTPGLEKATKKAVQQLQYVPLAASEVGTKQSTGRELV